MQFARRVILAGLLTLGAAAAPGTVTFQGTLHDLEGNPVSGLKTITFTFYPRQNSVVNVWQEQQAIEVVDGFYVAALGAETPFQDGLFAEAELWLGVKVGDDDEMTPRTRILAVPYALFSKHAEVADRAKSVDAATVGTVELAPASVTTEKLAPDSVTKEKLATGAVTTDKLADAAIDRDKLADDAVGSDEIQAAAVTADKLAPEAVGTDSLAVGAVKTGKLADSAVTGAKIADGNIDSSHIAEGAVDPVHIADEAIETPALAASAVTAPKLAPGAVETDAIKDDAVTAAKLATGAATTDSLAGLAVTTEKLADGAVAAVKLDANAVETNAIKDEAVTSAKLAAEAVTTASLAGLGVTTEKLADGAVTAIKLAVSAVETIAIKDEAVTAQKLAVEAVLELNLGPSAVSTSKLADEAVTTAKLAADSVDGTKIANSAVTTDLVADSAITTVKLADVAVTDAKLADSAVMTRAIANENVTTEKLAVGAVTAGKIAAGTISSTHFASGLGAVVAGSLVLGQTDAEPAMASAGYSRIGEVKVDSTVGWSPISRVGIPPIGEHSVVWTGEAMIVWGGRTTGSTDKDRPGAGFTYSIADNSWASISSSGAPMDRYDHAAVWTGEEMIIWGGDTNDFGSHTDGAAYTPSTDSWRPIADSNLIAFPGTGPLAIWSGAEMIVISGNSAGFRVARYSPIADSWSSVTRQDSPYTLSSSARLGQTATWCDTRLVVFGGGTRLDRWTWLYDPSLDSWEIVDEQPDTPEFRAHHSAVWTGSHLIVWGGKLGNELFANGAAFDLTTRTWQSISSFDAPEPRYDGHVAVWSGAEMIVWGGFTYGATTGGRYRFSDDSWSSMATSAVMPPSVGSDAFWLGTKMWVFGGAVVDGPPEAGGRSNYGAFYEPTLDIRKMTLYRKD